MLNLRQRRILHEFRGIGARCRQSGMSQYPQASFISSAHRAGQFVADTGAEVAFAGRSNAGKSSAINAIVNRRNFARTSKSPGRTQLVNFFQIAPDRRIVDLPGYGYARVSRSMREHWRSLMESYFAHRESLAGLFLIVDIRRGLGDVDWQMLDWLGQPGTATHVLLTKADKLKRGQAASSLAAAQRELGTEASVQLFSAQTKQGVEEARACLDGLLGLGESAKARAVR